MEVTFTGSNRILTFDHAELIDALALASGQEITSDVTLHVYDRRRQRRLAVHRFDDRAVFELHFEGEALDYLEEVSEPAPEPAPRDNSIKSISALGFPKEARAKKKVVRRKKKKGPATS